MFKGIAFNTSQQIVCISLYNGIKIRLAKKYNFIIDITNVEDKSFHKPRQC